MTKELRFGEVTYFLEEVPTEDGPGWIWIRVADEVSSYPISYLTPGAAQKAAEEDALSLELQPITLTLEHLS